MRAVIQRVSKAEVNIPSEDYHSAISQGFLILLGIEDLDDQEDINWLVKKIAGLRVFSDENDKMNLAIKDVKGEILVISQFTLHASTRKGNRPSFIKAARPDKAIPLYESFVKALEDQEITVQKGIFGADMKVGLVNDGPVTIMIDSKVKE